VKSNPLRVITRGKSMARSIAVPHGWSDVRSATHCDSARSRDPSITRRSSRRRFKRLFLEQTVGVPPLKRRIAKVLSEKPAMPWDRVIANLTPVHSM